MPRLLSRVEVDCCSWEYLFCFRERSSLCPTLFIVRKPLCVGQKTTLHQGVHTKPTFWVLDFGFWILTFWVCNPKSGFMSCVHTNTFWVTFWVLFTRVLLVPWGITPKTQNLSSKSQNLLFGFFPKFASKAKNYFLAFWIKPKKLTPKTQNLSQKVFVWTPY